MQRFLLYLFFTTLLPLAAQSRELPEIVVTADFRQAGELETASSVTVISQEAIKNRAAQHVEEMLHGIPNVNFAMGTSRARYLQIRGIGERSQFADPINPSVGLIIDEVDFSGIGTVATLFDVEQVEVLRGPQGTRYGANALAGLVNITTNAPQDEFEASIGATVAELDSRTLNAIVTGPLSESVSARLAVQQFRSDGYYDNSLLDVDDNNERDEVTVRGKLRFDISDDWRVDATLSHVDVDNGYDAFSLDNTRTTLSDEPGHDRQRSNSLSIVSDYTANAFTLQTIVGLARSDISYAYDEDWSFTGIHPFGYSSFDHYDRDRDTASLEVRLLSNESSRLFNDSTHWTLGVYLLDSQEDMTRTYTFLPGPFSSNYDFRTSAVFFQLDVDLTEQWVLATGFRLEKRDTDYDDSDAIGFSPTDSLWGGKIALEYFWDDHTLGYVSVARGYKAGGFNTDGNLDVDLREFDEEYLVEYELGLKTALIDNQLHLRGALFHDSRRDQQVKSSVVRVRANGSTEFIDFLGNAAEGTNEGLELVVDWQATEQLSFGASYAYLDARFDEFINEFGEDLSGRQQAQAPDYMASVTANYELGNFMFHLGVDRKDEYFFSDRHGVKSDAYTLVNASVAYQRESWSARLWARNLTDEDYFVRGFGSFGNDPRKNYATEPYYQYGEPSVMGITVEYTM